MLETVSYYNPSYINIACYFNSLIQSYFYIPDFANKILTNKNNSNDVKSSNYPRQQACENLTERLTGLFAKMALSDKKYTEPSEVLLAFVDDFGAPLLLGDQKDIGEFNLYFLERIEEGLGERIETKVLADYFK